MERIVAKHEREVPPMKRIGIIGGFGQWATLDLMERILKASVARVPQYGNRGYPSMDIRMCNNAPMLLNKDGSLPDILEPSEELLDAARFVGTNSDFVILLANTPHLFAKQVEEAAGKPLLSIVDVTVNEAVRRNYRRVGVMAIGVTVEKRLYQDPLEERGIEFVVLPKELSDKLDNEGVYPIQEGARAEEVSDIAFKALEYLREETVDGIILGCTEIPILFGKTSDDPDILNPSQLLAEAAVKKVLQD